MKWNYKPVQTEKGRCVVHRMAVCVHRASGRVASHCIACGVPARLACGRRGGRVGGVADVWAVWMACGRRG